MKRQRANAYDAAILPLLKLENIPSRAAFIGDEERDVAQTPEEMFAVLAAIPGAVVTVEEEEGG